MRQLGGVGIVFNAGIRGNFFLDESLLEVGSGVDGRQTQVDHTWELQIIYFRHLKWLLGWLVAVRIGLVADTIVALELLAGSHRYLRLSFCLRCPDHVVVSYFVSFVRQNVAVKHYQTINVFHIGRDAS